MTDQKQTDGSGLKTLEDLQRTVLIRIVDDDDRGCRINAEPAEGGGFTVYFTIPRR